MDLRVRSLFQVRLLIRAQPALLFGGCNFHEISFDDVIVLIQP